MPAIKIFNQNATLIRDPGALAFLSGGFGSEVNKRIAARGLQRDAFTNLLAPRDVPEDVRTVHEAYALAGADILTADTFCLNVGRQSGDVELVSRFAEVAGGLAREVTQSATLQKTGRTALVALSLTSIGPCYEPEQTPDQETLITVHRKNIELLKPHGDFILAETLPTLREAQAIADAAQDAKVPFMVAFCSNGGGLLRDGSTMKHVVNTVLAPNSYCMGVGVNCCPVDSAQMAVGALRQIFKAEGYDKAGKDILAYPNGFIRTVEEGGEGGEHHDHAVRAPEEFASVLQDLVNRGATVIGGCCGTTPAHTQAYKQVQPQFVMA